MVDSQIEKSHGCFKWTIVLCSFINHTLTVGLMYSLSVMYVSWLDEFHAGKGVTSWILSTGTALRAATSPIPASLAARFGFRKIAVIGGLLTALGLIASAFANSVTFLIVSTGIIAGVGTNFSYLPSISIVAFYFDKRRSLAVGLAVTGSGFGAFIFGPLVNVLIDTYTWRGTILLLGGISLNMCVTGLLFRPVRSKEGNRIPQEETGESINDKEILRPMKTEGDYASHTELEYSNIHEIKMPDVIVCKITENKSLPEESKRDPILLNSSTSNRFGNTYYSVTEKKRLDIDDRYRLHNSLNDLNLKSPKAASSYISLPHLDQGREAECSHDNFIKSMQYTDVTLFASIHGFHNLQDKAEKDERMRSRNQEVFDQTNVNLEHSKRNSSCLFRLFSSQIFKTNFKMLKDKAFLTFCISGTLTFSAQSAAVVFVVDRAVDQGIEKSISAILMSAIGVGNIVGRISTGIFVNSCLSNRLLVQILVVCLQGLGTILSIFCEDIVILHGIYATFLGFFMGAFATLAPLVTVDLKGVSNVATAYGLALVFMGMSSLIGIPVTGWLFDWTKSYAVAYALNGVLLVISGLILVPLLWRHTVKKQTDQS